MVADRRVEHASCCEHRRTCTFGRRSRAALTRNKHRGARNGMKSYVSATVPLRLHCPGFEATRTGNDRKNSRPRRAVPQRSARRASDRCLHAGRPRPRLDGFGLREHSCVSTITLLRHRRIAAPESRPSFCIGGRTSNDSAAAESHWRAA